MGSVQGGRCRGAVHARCMCGARALHARCRGGSATRVGAGLACTRVEVDSPQQPLPLLALEVHPRERGQRAYGLTVAYLPHHAAARRDELDQSPRAAQCGGRPVGKRGPLGVVAQQRGEVGLVRAAAEADLKGGA